MNDYGRAAVEATGLYHMGVVRSPEEAWKRATTGIFGHDTWAQAKGCPKGAFLGLCE